MKNGKNNFSNRVNTINTIIKYLVVPLSLRICDVVTTSIFLSLGIPEANPFMVWLMSIDMTLAFSFALIGGMIPYAMLPLLEKRLMKLCDITGYTEIGERIPLIISCAYFLMLGVGIYVIVNNITAIAYVDSRILV